MTAAPAANLHGVAVAAGGIGLLILGDSGAGKSALAARMIADWPFGKVRLVADDRVLIHRHGDRLVARPHPAIAGRLEIRGLGIVGPPVLEAVVLRGLLRLSDAQAERLPEDFFPGDELLGLALPCAMLPQRQETFQRLITIWPYFRDTVSTVRSNLMPAP